MVIHSEDAGHAGTYHFDHHALSQAHFLQPVNKLFATVEIGNATALSRLKHFQRNDLRHGMHLKTPARRQIEIESQFDILTPCYAVCIREASENEHPVENAKPFH